MNNHRYKLWTLGMTWLLFLACNKSTFNDLGGKLTLSGTVSLSDTLTGNYTHVPFRNGIIYLARSTDKAGAYLYKTTTNTEGVFSFHGLSDTTAYKIFASSDTGQFKLGVQKIYSAGSLTDNQSDQLVLYPTDSNNVVHLVLHGPDGAKMPGVTAWVYNSPTFFNTGTADGKLFDLTTSNLGVANKKDLAPGNYYFRVKTMVGNMALQGTGQVVLKGNGIVNMPIRLAAYSTITNGLDLTILDHYATPVQNALVTGYRSKITFLLDSTGVYGLFTASSNTAGKVMLTNVDAALYYLRVTKIIGKDTLRTIDSAAVTAASITTKSIIFK